MRFDADWLRDVGSAAHLEVVQHHADRIDEIPADVIARAEVLYTGSCFPDRLQAPSLRWVQLDTSGADHVAGTDLWENDDVTITSIGGVSPRPIAGYVMLMILGFAHRLPIIVDHQRRREWPSFDERWERFLPTQLDGSTMVVIGYGRLGEAVGRAARAFGIDVIGVRRTVSNPRAGQDESVLVVGRERLNEMLTRADHVVVTAPLTSETRNLLGSSAFAALKPGAVLVNVSRGGVVDEAAMLRALDNGTLAGVAADVFAQEPLDPANPLWDDPRVIVTPHVAGFAPDYRERVQDLFKANLAHYAAGEPLINVIDRNLGY